MCLCIQVDEVHEQQSSRFARRRYITACARVRSLIHPVRTRDTSPVSSARGPTWLSTRSRVGPWCPRCDGRILRPAEIDGCGKSHWPGDGRGFHACFAGCVPQRLHLQQARSSKIACFCPQSAVAEDAPRDAGNQRGVRRPCHRGQNAHDPPRPRPRAVTQRRFRIFKPS